MKRCLFSSNYHNKDRQVHPSFMKDFIFMIDESSVLSKNLSLIVVDERHTVETCQNTPKFNLTIVLQIRQKSKASLCLAFLPLCRISIWPANCPFFAVGEWIANGAAKRGWTEGAMQPLGARPLSTTHTRPRSTARQPDETGWESILLREENRNAQRKTLGVRLISIETQPTYERRMRSRVRRGARHERYLWAILMSSLTLQIMNRETERL